MPSRNPMIVEVMRGQVVESSHQVVVTIVDENARSINSWGNFNLLTVPRSSIKMLQALPLIETGAADKYSLGDKELALACASHCAEKHHLDVITDWAKKIGISEQQLVCGPHMPTNEKAMHEVIRKGGAATKFMNNCSGKHLGILSVLTHLGEPVAGYEQYEHAAQKRLRKILSETMRVDHNKLPHLIDGCSIFTYAVPLQQIAVGMASLLDPKQTELRKAAAKRLIQAVVKEPTYLAGSEDFVTLVNQKTQGRIIVKVGAEGVYTGLIPAKGLAFAVKSIDGSRRAAEFVTAQVLRSYAGFSDTEQAELKNFIAPVVKNWRGEETGKIRLAGES